MAKTTFSGPVQSLGGFEDENGDPISGGGTPGGSDAQVQVNNNGAFAGISEGTSGQVLKSNGAGVAPSFQTDATNSPGGSNTEVQFNDNGTFGAVSNGTSGQFLTSNGSGNAATFQTYTPNLTSYTVATAPTSGNSVGDLIYATDGDSGQPTIAVWDGSNWIGVSNTRSTISAGGGA